MTAPGYSRYKAFAAEVHDSPDDDENRLSVLAFDSNVVSEDKQEGESDTDGQEEAMSYLPDSRDSPLITDLISMVQKSPNKRLLQLLMTKRTRFPKTSKPSSYNGTIN